MLLIKKRVAYKHLQLFLQRGFPVIFFIFLFFLFFCYFHLCDALIKCQVF